ncbi:MAG: 30S ribosomal protein S12 methylthiotransferase RimO [Prevotella sp.]|nr:30S ribosomal protein S12 methylthiotransferase RimO [Prevotella sp.]
MKSIGIITLGCSKNLVDSEVLMGKLHAIGYDVKPECADADIVVVNTCGFIGDAKQESINTILELVQAKEDGKICRLYVMGCLSERYREDLTKEIPQVDRYFGKFDWHGLIEELQCGTSNQSAVCQRMITTPKHYAYIKIAEGCNRSCAYCAIPLMTGYHKSRPQQEILDEVRELVARGCKEFQIIAQETTFYGLDLNGKNQIAELIERISEIDGVRWVRLHYAYPTDFPMDLLKVMRERRNVCRYLDIAFQHISDNVLQRMHRHFTKSETYALIREIRRQVPGIALRTTLMVGFPGETEEDFEELLNFVREVRFDRMGAFAYSEEDGTFAEQHYTDDVPENVKQERLDRLMMVQQEVSKKLHKSLVGTCQLVIIDRVEGDFYVGRTEYSSPDVDPEVLISRSENLQIGHFYETFITGAEEFDLYGTTQRE